METSEKNIFKKIWKTITLEKVNIVFTMITVGVSSFIAYQSYQIQTKIDIVNNSIARANLVKDLLDSLTSSQDNQKTKKDISLIILNRTINQDPQTKLMIAEIAEQLYKENLTKVEKFAQDFDNNNKDNKRCNLNDIAAFPTSVVAFNIMEENDPERAKAIIKKVGKPIPIKDSSRIAPAKSCLEQLDKYYSFLNTVVWFQFNNKSYQTDINNFATKLRTIGWKVPTGKNNTVGECKLSGYYWKNDEKPISTVRYYHISDQTRAERLQKLSESFFKQSFGLDDMSVTLPNQPFGQIEILVHYDQDSCP